MLSHEAIIERTDAADKGLRITSDDVVGWVLSMSFHFVVTILLFLRRGAMIVLCGDPMPGALADTLQRRDVTVLYASPIHYRLLTLADALTPARFASVRLAISTAVKLPEAIARAFHQRFGLRLTEAYGIIEVGLPFIHCPPGGAHDGGLGRPLPDYTVRLGEDDEVLIRGKGMFDAYFSPWQPRAVCQPDGWFHTGDVGAWTEDGGLRLVGRRKAVINFSGMKLFPQEIEECSTHPALPILVYGEPTPNTADPCAGCVREGPPWMTRLLASASERLRSTRFPKTFIRVPALEKTASGKIRRKRPWVRARRRRRHLQNPSDDTEVVPALTHRFGGTEVGLCPTGFCRGSASASTEKTARLVRDPAEARYRGGTRGGRPSRGLSTPARAAARRRRRGALGGRPEWRTTPISASRKPIER